PRRRRLEMHRPHGPFPLPLAGRRRRTGGPSLGAQKGVGELSSETEVLVKKFSELLRWERRKRREQVCATASCYALAAALLALPFYAFLRAPWSRWMIPIVLFAV